MGATTTSSTVFTQLNAEWHQLTHQYRYEITVTAWAQADERLQGVRSLTEIEEAAAGEITEHTDHLFRALLDIANGDGPSAGAELAGRTILQLMMGRVVVNAMALSALVGDAEEQAQGAVATMWQTIRETPADRRRFVTPYLAWTSHRKAKQFAQVGAREIPVESMGERDPLGADPALNSSEELLKLLTWSVAEKVISAPAAELLLERYGTTSPQRSTWVSLGDPAPIAERRQISPDAMRQRCSRTARALSRAAARYIATNTF